MLRQSSEPSGCTLRVMGHPVGHGLDALEGNADRMAIKTFATGASLASGPAFAPRAAILGAANQGASHSTVAPCTTHLTLTSETT